MHLTGSLVLYGNANAVFEPAIASFVQGAANGVLFVIDNSPVPLTSAWFQHERVRYRHAGSNLGFGAGHNMAIRELSSGGAHLLLNPDVEFGAEVLPAVCHALLSDTGTVALMPRIVYPDGTLQRLCKLLPTPLDLFARRFLPWRDMKARLNAVYELHALPQSRSSVVPSLSGCMLLARTEDLLAIGGFDERYFMYMEDVDLVRRLGDRGATRYLPSVSAIHGYGKGSYRNRRLLGYHLISAIRYFNKWGWIFDPTRRQRNQACKRTLGL